MMQSDLEASDHFEHCWKNLANVDFVKMKLLIMSV